jgi:hypothetical protein
MNPNNFYSITGFADKHSAFSVAALRNIRFYCKENGFESAFFNLGRKILIDEDIFFECLRRNNVGRKGAEA